MPFTRYLAVLSITLLAVVPAFANHFNHDTTDVNASILVIDAVLTSRHWGPGDELALVMPNGHCAGSAVVQGFPLGMAAWGDDVLTDSLVEGYHGGDTMRFVGWDASTNEEFPISEMMPLEGDSIWHANGVVFCHLAESGRQFRPTPTYIVHRITCSDAQIAINNAVRPLSDLDQIGILTPGGVVAGIMIWNEETQQASGWIFGDDTTTANIVEGFRPGEAFSAAYWLRGENQRYSPVTVTVQSGDSTFRDNGSSDVSLAYRVSGINPAPLPIKFAVTGPYPNPFNGVGSVEVALPQASVVSYAIYDELGRTVSHQKVALSTGYHRISLSLASSPTGVYLCRVEVGIERREVKLVLVK